MQPKNLLGPLRNKEDVTVATVRNNSAQHLSEYTLQEALAQVQFSFKTFRQNLHNCFLNRKLNSKCVLLLLIIANVFLPQAFVTLLLQCLHLNM